MARDYILHKIRTALGRSAGQAPAPIQPVYLNTPEVSLEARIESFRSALEALAGRVFGAADAGQARDYAAELLSGRTAVASNAPFLKECGILEIPCVESGFTSRDALRAACAAAAAGITSADYALADTGTLVMLSSPEEARLISLLPPLHLAIVPRSRLLSGLDELFALLPKPGDRTSSMVLITGPSRTADIEQILVRGVHGPGEIHVVMV
jgi:L-lactate dehydrogenase complex protein LldG